ncbi:MAG TPA: endonuclease [Candidatus Paceibacterota bacterium]|jgi:hypothetical protein|nr:endonuclease [Candidatus Paceibacterota bacterium]
MPESKETSRYKAIIGHIFRNHWKKGIREFVFVRPEIEDAAKKLSIALPKNVGDAVYSIRYRTPLPSSIVDTQPKGLEWIIEGAGRSKYRFKLVPATRIRPRAEMVCTLVPDATPEVIQLYKLDDEQALLAIVRYNRLIDIFLGLTTFSLQNHLRTTVKDVGQIEIDELYVGLDSDGCHYVIPVQAKGGNDQIGVVQTAQDIRYCAQTFPGIRCRPIAAQFLPDGVIALFELVLQGDEIKVVEERHYKLVPAKELDEAAVRRYRSGRS